MRSFLFLAIPITLGLFFAACSGAPGHSDCETSADCSGHPCTPLTPGGYRVCIEPAAEATSCDFMGLPNKCCSTAECPSGAGCYATTSICSGPPKYNVCVADTCTSDADCPQDVAPAICLPAGAYGFPKRRCMNAYCKTDADCTAESGGACVPIGHNPCCDLHLPHALVCAYPGDCGAGAPCPSDQTCRLDPATGTGVCNTKTQCSP